MLTPFEVPERCGNATPGKRDVSSESFDGWPCFNRFQLFFFSGMAKKKYCHIHRTQDHALQTAQLLLPRSWNDPFKASWKTVWNHVWNHISHFLSGDLTKIMIAMYQVRALFHCLWFITSVSSASLLGQSAIYMNLRLHAIPASKILDIVLWCYTCPEELLDQNRLKKRN